MCPLDHQIILCAFQKTLKSSWRAFKVSTLYKSSIFQCMDIRIWYLVNFKGTLCNSTQNILPIHWKMCISFTGENLRALRFKGPLEFLTHGAHHNGFTGAHDGIPGMESSKSFALILIPTQQTRKRKYDSVKSQFCPYHDSCILSWRMKNYNLIGHFPLNTWRNNDVVITSTRRHFGVITSKLRRFDVITTSLFWYESHALYKIWVMFINAFRNDS